MQEEYKTTAKIQEQINIITKNIQILNGDTSDLKDIAITRLQNEIKTSFETIGKLSVSILNLKGYVAPKIMTTKELQDAGIIEKPVEKVIA